MLLGVAVERAVVVRAVTPIVDVRSSDASLTVTDNRFNALPLEHSYRGLFQLSPGVPDNRSQVGLSAGGSRQDNTYLLDGANITSPGVRHPGDSGQSARHRRSEPDARRRHRRVRPHRRHRGQRREPQRLEPVLGARPRRLAARGAGQRLRAARRSRGGRPAAGRRSAIRCSPRRSNPPPASAAHSSAISSSSTAPRATSTTPSGAASTRSTWRCPTKCGRGPSTSARSRRARRRAISSPFSHRDHPIDVDAQRPHLGLRAERGHRVGDRSSRVTALDWAWFHGPRRSVNVRYQRTREINEDVPVTALRLQPPFDPARLTAMGQYTDPAQANLITGAREFTNAQNYRRHEVRATVGQYFDVGRTSHVLKARRRLRVRRRRRSAASPTGGAPSPPVTVNDVPALRARYYTPQPPQLGQGDTYSLFVQDAVTISNRLSVTAGVLLTRDSFAQQRGAQRRLPADDSAEGRRGGVRIAGRHLHLPAVRLRRRDSAAPRRQLSAPQGRGRQGLRRLGPLLQHGSEIERPQPGARFGSSRRRRSSI